MKHLVVALSLLAVTACNKSSETPAPSTEHTLAAPGTGSMGSMGSQMQTGQMGGQMAPAQPSGTMGGQMAPAQPNAMAAQPNGQMGGPTAPAHTGNM